MKQLKKYGAALIQASPVLFNKTQTIEKAVMLCEQAAKEGAVLVVFPEAFIPAYPRGFTFGAAVGSRSQKGRELWQLYFENSIDMSKDELKPIRQVAKSLDLHISLGITEIDSATQGTLYCSNVLIDHRGEVLVVHRKLKPTGTERVIWGEGKGDTLQVFDTALGKIGSLICWENYMPLARMALYQQGVQVYLAPTADARPTWQSTLQHIACEGRCFVLGCNQYVEKKMYPATLQQELTNLSDVMCVGGTAAYNPLGTCIVTPVYEKEAILYTEIDLSVCTQGKMDFDVAGHYHRADVFQFNYPKA